MPSLNRHDQPHAFQLRQRQDDACEHNLVLLDEWHYTMLCHHIIETMKTPSAEIHCLGTLCTLHECILEVMNGIDDPYTINYRQDTMHAPITAKSLDVIDVVVVQ